jgi:hypothetical protein
MRGDGGQNLLLTDQAMAQVGGQGGDMRMARKVVIAELGIVAACAGGEIAQPVKGRGAGGREC